MASSAPTLDRMFDSRWADGLDEEQLVDTARRLVLEGMPLVDVAAAAGFHDQAHLSRHFVRVLGTTPGRFAGRRAGPRHA